jgi:hypothetical protein
MRTTVTIDPDVEELLRQAMQQTRESFKATLNRAIRIGLAGMGTPTDEPPFSVAARSMGVRAGIDPARLNQQSDQLEIAALLEVTSKLQQPDRVERPIGRQQDDASQE